MAAFAAITMKCLPHVDITEIISRVLLAPDKIKPYDSLAW